MSVFCITASMPDVAYCAVFGEHDRTCDDDACRGCAPRPAAVGNLCNDCYERAVAAAGLWAWFVRLVEAAGGRLVAAEGGGSTPDGYVNLTPAWMLIDAAKRHNTRGNRTVDGWVESPAGAMEAVRFTRAAETAYARLEVEPRPDRPVRPHPCPHCGEFTQYGNHQTKRRGTTTVTCENCGELLAVIRADPATHEVASPDCAIQAHAHCVSETCPCHCHMLGAQSRPGGVQALWDADQATTNPGYRAGWVITDRNTIEPREERTAA